MNIPYNSSDFAFTLDDSRFLTITTLNENTFFTLELIIRYYDFYASEEKTKTLDYKIPLFNKSAIFNIGRIVHRVMSSVGELSSTENQYKTAMVSITLKEYFFSDIDTVESSETITNIPFIAGILPKIKTGNFAVLSVNNEASRVTPKGTINVSFLLPNGTHELELLRNFEVINTETVVVSGLNNIITKRLIVADYNAAPGDVFKWNIKTKNVYKNIIVFPEVPKSNQLFFINEFKLLESIECTGKVLFSEDQSQVTHTYMRNFVEYEEVIETTKKNTLLINTGWVLKTDNVTIGSINRSPKAWFFINENEAIELIPVPKSFENFNSDQALYSYPLNFKINKSSDAQNYTF